jgi:hypothetical protein
VSLSLDKPQKAPDRPRKPLKRSRLPKVRKTTFAAQKRRLDTLCASAVRERDGHRCTVCGSQGEEGRKLDWCHLLSRRYLNTRWAWENSTTACRSCHQKYTRAPAEWVVYMQTRMGLVAWEKLYVKAMAYRGKCLIDHWFYYVAAGPSPTDKPW